MTPIWQQRRDGFAAQKTIPELAATHGRTPGAITARLVRLGLIEEGPSDRPGRSNRPLGASSPADTDGEPSPF